MNCQLLRELSGRNKQDRSHYYRALLLLVVVVGRLAGTVLGKVEVLELLVAEDGQRDAESLEVSSATSDLLIQLVGQGVGTERVLLRVVQWAI